MTRKWTEEEEHLEVDLRFENHFPFGSTLIRIVVFIGVFALMLVVIPGISIDDPIAWIVAQGLLSMLGLPFMEKRPKEATVEQFASRGPQERQHLLDHLGPQEARLIRKAIDAYFNHLQEQRSRSQPE